MTRIPWAWTRTQAIKIFLSFFLRGGDRKEPRVGVVLGVLWGKRPSRKCLETPQPVAVYGERCLVSR